MRKVFIILIVLLISVVGYVLFKKNYGDSDAKVDMAQVCVCGDIPGVLLKGKDGDYTGYEYELLTKALVKMDKKFTIKDIKFPFVIQEATTSKEENVIIAGGIDYEFHKEQIEKNKLRVVIYGDLHPQFVYSKDAKSNNNNAKIKVGVQVGAYRPKLSIKAEVEFVEFAEISDMIIALEEKRVGGIILDSNDKVFKDKLKNFMFKELEVRKACFILSNATKDEFHKNFEACLKVTAAEIADSKIQNANKKTESKVMAAKPVNSATKTAKQPAKTQNKSTKKKV